MAEPRVSIGSVSLRGVPPAKRAAVIAAVQQAAATAASQGAQGPAITAAIKTAVRGVLATGTGGGPS